MIQHPLCAWVRARIPHRIERSRGLALSDISDAAFARVMQRRAARDGLINSSLPVSPNSDEFRLINFKWPIATPDARSGTPVFFLSASWNDLAGDVVAQTSIFDDADQYYRSHPLIGSTIKQTITSTTRGHSYGSLTCSIMNVPLSACLTAILKGYASVMFQEDPAAGRRSVCAKLFAVKCIAPLPCEITYI